MSCAAITLLCYYGYLPLLDAFLSHQFWTPLARLSYGAYLCHPLVIAFAAGNLMQFYTFGAMDLVYRFCGNSVLSFLGSLLLWSLVERPCMTIFSPTKKKRASESDKSQQKVTPSTPDTTAKNLTPSIPETTASGTSMTIPSFQSAIESFGVKPDMQSGTAPSTGSTTTAAAKEPSLKERFEAAAEDAKVEPTSSKIGASNANMANIYGLYKQANKGDINIPQPWAVQVTEKAKWDAWNARKGMSTEDAMQAYIDEVEKLKRS
jgi:diazepam-binding inhibitor (GABA receptor modulating acyl-CoA-binding protein)